MKEILSIVNELKATTKTNEKIAILTKNKDNELLQKVLFYTYNPNYQFGLSEKKIRQLIDNKKSFIQTSITGFELLDKLRSSNINDNLRALVLTFLLNQTAEMRELWISIICKDIRANISDKTINKVWKGLIPTWEIQQGRPIEKAPLKKNEEFILSTKANGINCSYYKGKLISRQGKEFVGLDHIIEQIEKLGLQDYFINGELIRNNIDGLTNEANFRETTSIVNSDEPNKPNINFVIFDMVQVDEFDNDNCSVPYGDRVDSMKQLSRTLSLSNSYPNINVITFHYRGTDQSMIDKYLDMVVANDEEGLMCIPTKSMYKRKRHNDIKKVKRFYTCDLKVVGYEEGDGRLKGTLGTLFVDYKGNRVGVGSGYTDEQRTLIWANKDNIEGVIIEVKYKEITKDKKTGLESLQFPVFVGIRNDKTEPSYN